MIVIVPIGLYAFFRNSLMNKLCSEQNARDGNSKSYDNIALFVFDRRGFFDAVKGSLMIRCEGGKDVES